MPKKPGKILKTGVAAVELTCRGGWVEAHLVMEGKTPLPLAKVACAWLGQDQEDRAEAFRLFAEGVAADLLRAFTGMPVYVGVVPSERDP